MAQAEGEFWRQEVISRVQQHRARRRRRLDSQATLQLDFQDGMASPAAPPEGNALAPLQRRARRQAPKIIEFPRPAAQERTDEPAELELAEPVVEAPRILDAPEPPPQQMDLLFSFADIQLQAEEPRCREELEVPVQPAPIGYRLVAGLADAVIVLLAGVLLALGFALLVSGLPQPRMALLCGLTVCGSLWLIYQYLFLVYSAGTPGMQLAQLELCTFQGGPVPLRLRRWRAFAGVLSALAIGLGYAWVLVDEDTLGWHDRMTQTYLRPSGKEFHVIESNQ